MVMSWLINSKNMDISENFILYRTAYEIWEVAVFEIETALHDLKQGNLEVIQYFNSLNHYWQLLDTLEDIS